jgi:hypothetical protein
MAKIETGVRGSAFQPKGTMSKVMLDRFKLKGNLPVDVYHSRNRKAVAASARALKTYRMNVHGCNERHLPACLRHTVHYFLTQLTRYDSDNPRDRRGIEKVADNTTSVLVQGVETETLTLDIYIYIYIYIYI